MDQVKLWLMPILITPAISERGDTTGDVAGPQITDPERQREGQDATGEEQLVHEHEVGIGEEVGRVLLTRRRLAAEGPTDVGVPQPAQAAYRGRADPERRVGIADPIGESVVAPMVGHPADQGALERHRAEDREDDLQRPAGLERPMGEETVESHGHTVTDHDEEDRGQRDREPRDGPIHDHVHDHEREHDQRAERHDPGEHLPVELGVGRWCFLQPLTHIVGINRPGDVVRLLENVAPHSSSHGVAAHRRGPEQ